MLGAVVRQFFIGMVCCTNGYFIALKSLMRIEESFGSTLNPRPRAQTAFSSLCKC